MSFLCWNAYFPIVKSTNNIFKKIALISFSCYKINYKSMELFTLWFLLEVHFLNHVPTFPNLASDLHHHYTINSSIFFKLYFFRIFVCFHLTFAMILICYIFCYNLNLEKYDLSFYHDIIKNLFRDDKLFCTLVHYFNLQLTR